MLLNYLLLFFFFFTIGKTLYTFVCYRDHNKHKTQRRGKLYGISLISEKKHYTADPVNIHFKNLKLKKHVTNVFQGLPG